MNADERETLASGMAPTASASVRVASARVKINARRVWISIRILVSPSQRWIPWAEAVVEPVLTDLESASTDSTATSPQKTSVSSVTSSRRLSSNATGPSRRSFMIVASCIARR